MSALISFLRHPMKMPAVISTFGLSSSIQILHTVEEVDEDNIEEEQPANFLPALEGVKVVLLTGNLLDVLKKKKYAQLFDQAYFGNLAVVPLFQEAGILAGSDKTREAEAFGQVASAAAEQVSAGSTGKAAETAGGAGQAAEKAPEGLESSAALSSLVRRSLKETAVVTVESMKHQVHFDGRMKLGYRQRIGEAMDKLEFEAARPGQEVKLKDDLKELDAREQEKNAPNFLFFRRRRECEKLD